MDKMRIGRTDMWAGVLALGTWAIGGGERWGDNDERMSVRAICEAVACDVNLIDTAPGYGALGYSEVVLGRALAQMSRSDIIVSTKCGIWWQDDEGAFLNRRDGRNIYINLTRRAVERSLDDSLKRLGTDYVDILFIHYPAREPFLTPPRETMSALEGLKRAGKIRAIGVCNVTTEQLEEYMQYGRIDIVQMKFSLLSRSGYNALAPLCRDGGITFQAYSPIEQGLLSDAVRADYVPPQGNARCSNQWWAMDRRANVMEMLERMRVFCAKYDCSVENLAIAWAAMYSENINVLCGARTVEQVRRLTGRGVIRLTNEDFSLIGGIADRLILVAGSATQ